jgi:peptidoglycan/LPS O-acetylase OafA/YrhL
MFGLDVLRTLAITQVLVGHGLTIYMGAEIKAPLEGFFGFLGVEIFFVLSGFLVGSIALDLFAHDPTPAGAADFLARRWIRTLPNYYLFLGVHLAFMRWVGGSGFTVGYLVFLQNLLQPMPEFFAESWSLTIEEWFYLILPVMLVGAGRVTRDPIRLRALLLGVLVLCTVIRLVAVVALEPAFAPVVRKTALLRFDSLMYGVLAAWMARFDRARFLHARTATLIAGVSLTVVSVEAVVALSRHHVWGASLALGGVSLGIAQTLPFLSTWHVRPGAVRTGIEWISRISFSLYLCHLPLARLLPLSGLGRGPVPLLVWLTASIAAASVIHVGFERPLMHLRHRLPNRRHVQTAI